jgi:hypothetical protein
LKKPYEMKRLDIIGEKEVFYRMFLWLLRRLFVPSLLAGSFNAGYDGREWTGSYVETTEADCYESEQIYGFFASGDDGLELLPGRW